MPRTLGSQRHEALGKFIKEKREKASVARIERSEIRERSSANRGRSPGFTSFNPGYVLKTKWPGKTPATKRFSRRRCGASAASAALLIRDRSGLRARYDPGSAAHHFVLRCARETFLFNPTAQPSRSDGRG